MSLRPVLKLKVDELFLRWLSNQEVQSTLGESLQRISKGEVVRSTSPTLSFQYNSPGGSGPASPLVRSGSPSALPSPNSPPPFQSLPSPRSPRRRSNSHRLSTSLSKSQAAKFFHDQQSQQNNVQNVAIPKFYFPHGEPVPAEENIAVLQRLTEVFQSLPEQKAYTKDMHQIAKACKCPKYWRMVLYHGAGGEEDGFVTQQAFMNYWKRVIKDFHDEASRFFYLLAKPGCTYLVSEDFIPIIQDVVDDHPGLSFLQDAPEFHSRYIHTVIARIFYCLNRSWTGKITLAELRRSNLLSVIALLEEEDDINQITEYFSYEHFYVIYCKFWELDADHDLLIDKADLARHQDHAISNRIIDRIFSPGTVLSTKSARDEVMTYTEFVWFIMSEEDKKTPVSIEYWFRCLDIDGDGTISMYELEYFYEEQLTRMENMGIETLPFEDCLCQMFDMVKPRVPDKITLRDLKTCKLAYIFFDTFFNLDKFLDHEQRDPFASTMDPDSDEPEITDWERYAAEEYEILVAEEGIQEEQNLDDAEMDEGDYEDDFEPADEIISVSFQQKASINDELENSDLSEDNHNKFL